MNQQQMFSPPMMFPMPMPQQQQQHQMPVVVQAAFKYLEHVHLVEDSEFIGVVGTDVEPGHVETMKGRSLNKDEERARLRALEVLQNYFAGDLPADEVNPDRPVQLLVTTEVAARMLHDDMAKKAKVEGQPDPMPDWAGGGAAT